MAGWGEGRPLRDEDEGMFADMAFTSCGDVLLVPTTSGSGAELEEAEPTPAKPDECRE